MRRPIGPQQPARPRGIEPVTVGAAIKPRAQDVGDAISSWMCSGSSFFPLPVKGPWQAGPPPGAWPFLIPDTDYAEIVCAYYVPPGHVAWVHDVEIAPFIAPGVFTVSEFRQQVQVISAASFWQGSLPIAHWQTGPVWEAYPGINGTPAPAWEWAIVGCSGNVYRQARGKVQAPAPGVPVPKGQIDRLGFQAVYAGQLPEGQTFSRIPTAACRGAEGPLNIQIAEDTTIALVVRGRNSVIEIVPAVVLPPSPAYNSTVFAGSFGHLRGYQQKTLTDAARRNASRGLGS